MWRLWSVQCGDYGLSSVDQGYGQPKGDYDLCLLYLLPYNEFSVYMVMYLKVHYVHQLNSIDCLIYVTAMASGYQVIKL